MAVYAELQPIRKRDVRNWRIKAMRKTLIILGIVVMVVYVLITAFVAVDVTQSVVITQFGKPVRVVTEPGLIIKWPDPVQTVIRLDKRLRQ